MDALKSLKAEIERKKRQLQESDVLVPDKKYFKRGELAAKQTEEYMRRHFQLSNSSSTTSDEKDVQSSEKHKTDDEEKVSQLPRKEVIRKLRERGEPITLFGETHYEAYLRLKRLEALMPDITSGMGENDFKTAMDAVDAQYLNDIIASTDKPSDAATDVSVKDDGTTEDDVQKMRDELGKGDKNKDQDIILRFFKQFPSLILRVCKLVIVITWTMDMFQQMEDGLLESFVEIVQMTMDRDYIRAVKRLLTQCQKLFPTIPSRSFNYQSPV
nr:hypothetical protein BaRGS_031942 [Batillaria attramentaria]